MEADDDKAYRKAVDLIFEQYDTQKTGTLKRTDLKALISDVLVAISENSKVTEDEVTLVVQGLDHNNNGFVTRDELYLCLKKLNSAATAVT